MPARDYDASPVADSLSLDKVIRSLADDLEQLRRGDISVNDAIARSMLAKQIFNGARIYLSAAKMLSEKAKPVEPLLTQTEGASDGDDR